MTVDTEHARASAQNSTSIAAETLGRDLLAIMVDELKVAPNQWGKMSKSEQAQTLERMREKVRRLVPSVLAILFRGEYPAARAQLEQLTIKDGMKAVLKLPVSDEAMQLVDAVSHPVVIVVSDPDQFLARMEEIRAQEDQHPLFEDDPGDAQGATDDLFRDIPPELGGPSEEGEKPEATPAVVELPAAREFTLRDRLESLGIRLSDEWIASMTPEQRDIADTWAREFEAWVDGDAQEANGIKPAPVRPHYLPVPDPEVREAWFSAETRRQLEQAQAEFFAMTMVNLDGELPNIYATRLDPDGRPTDDTFEVEEIAPEEGETILQTLQRQLPGHSFTVAVPGTVEQRPDHAEPGEQVDDGQGTPPAQEEGRSDEEKPNDSGTVESTESENAERPALNERQSALLGKLFAMRIEMPGSEIRELTDEEVERGISWADAYTAWQDKPQRKGRGPARPGYIPAPTE